MDYKLSTKNSAGKWWQYGSIKTNQYGNQQVSFAVSKLKELIELAESQNKTWVNLCMFEDNGDKAQKPSQHTIDKGNAYQVDLDEDSIPFN